MYFWTLKMTSWLSKKTLFKFRVKSKLLTCLIHMVEVHFMGVHNIQTQNKTYVLGKEKDKMANTNNSKSSQ